MPERFETKSVGRAATGLILSGLLLMGAFWWQRDSRRASRQAFEEGRLAAAQDAEVRRRTGERATALQEAIALEKESERLARIARALQTVQTSNHGENVCNSMAVLEQEQVSEAIPDLIAILDRATTPMWVRNCAAGALITLGVTDQPIEFFKECLRVGTSEARGLAVSGFGKVGPAAADLAIPVLHEEMQSQNAFIRRAAVRALVNLGPAAAPLLNQAAQDRDMEVRDLAKTALAKP